MTATDALAESRRAANLAMVRRLATIVLLMFGFGFAMVPFYEKICQVTGIRDLARPDEVKSTQVDTSRSIRVEFDSNLRNLPWTFRPVEPIRRVHPGEVVQVVYEIENPTDRAVAGQAIPSYGPPLAAQYFRKLECFCFTRQVLQPHERRRMPVVFVIDPSLPKDVATITLSYTFFEVEGATKGRASGDARERGRPDAAAKT